LSGKAVVAVEAVRNWYWLYELLEDLGVEVKLVHPRKVRLIAESKNKSDTNDTYLGEGVDLEQVVVQVVGEGDDAAGLPDSRWAEQERRPLIGGALLPGPHPTSQLINSALVASHICEAARPEPVGPGLALRGHLPISSPTRASLAIRALSCISGRAPWVSL